MDVTCFDPCAFWIGERSSTPLATGVDCVPDMNKTLFLFCLLGYGGIPHH